jgi:hypothetical protein
VEINGINVSSRNNGIDGNALKLGYTLKDWFSEEKGVISVPISQ